MAAEMYAIDFGTGIALQIWGPNGPVPKKSLEIPRVPGGKTPKDEFILILRALLNLGDVVVESATVRSSGVELEDVIETVKASSNIFYTITTRAVKNYRKDNGREWHKGGRYVKDGRPQPVYMQLHEQASVHVEDAEIIYKIATETPWRLRVWHVSEPCPRIHKSVRPMDKRGYRDETSLEYKALLPSFDSLPTDLQETLGVKGDYSLSLIMPFAMALTEPWWKRVPRHKRRNRFLKVLGAYDAGYPSFYRRMTVDWMQENAKMLAGVTRMDEVPKDVRKQAWKVTQKQIRTLFYLSTAR